MHKQPQPKPKPAPTKPINNRINQQSNQSTTEPINNRTNQHTNRYIILYYIYVLYYIYAITFYYYNYRFLKNRILELLGRRTAGLEVWSENC